MDHGKGFTGDRTTAQAGTALGKHEAVIAGYVFGSIARGDATQLSDIDLAVLLQPAPDDELFRTRIELLGAMAKSLGSNKVDLVVLNTAPLALVYRVLRDGRLIYERPGRRRNRVRFEADAYVRYFDFRVLERRIHRAMRQRVKEGKFGG